MKKTFFFLLTVILFAPILQAQVIFDKSSYDFGDIEKGDSLFVDFKLTNVSNKPAEIKNIETPYGINYLYTNKTILPDSTVLLRLYYIPKIKGEFDKLIKVYISILRQPLLFTVKGNLKYANVHASQEVPAFPPALTQKLKPRANAKFKIIDAQSKEPIENADVKLIWNGVVYKNFSSKKRGKESQKMYLGNFYLVANAEGYKTKEFSFKLSKDGQNILVEMGEGQSPEPVVVENEKPKTEDKDTAEKIVEQPKEQEPIAELDKKLYKPINVVFLIDRSGSMGRAGRLDLLKVSMIQLLKVLRPIDRIAVIAFAKESHTIVASQFVDDKNAIQKAIRKIKASGHDKMSQGIKVAYNIGQFGFIRNGNNMIIVATDGGSFAITADASIYHYVAEKTKKGFNLSVIGIKSASQDASALKKLSESGDGDYINIDSYSDAKNNLLNEIKSKSLRRE